MSEAPEGRPGTWGCLGTVRPGMARLRARTGVYVEGLAVVARRMLFPRPAALSDGRWESWRDPEGSVVRSCAIVTTEPNELMRPIRDRMPLRLFVPPRGEDQPVMADRPDVLLPVITRFGVQ